MCGGCSGALWLPSHHPGGCCTLVVVKEIPQFYVMCFEYQEKRYINVTNYYYYKNLPYFFPLFFVNLKCFIIGKLVWLYCSDNLQNSKTNMTKNRDKIVNRDISKKNCEIIFFPYRSPLLETFVECSAEEGVYLRALRRTVFLNQHPPAPAEYLTRTVRSCNVCVHSRPLPLNI